MNELVELTAKAGIDVSAPWFYPFASVLCSMPLLFNLDGKGRTTDLVNPPLTAMASIRTALFHADRLN